MEWLAGVSKLQEYIRDYWTGLAESKKISHVLQVPLHRKNKTRNNVSPICHCIRYWRSRT